MPDPNSVPKAMQARYDEIMSLIEPFSRERLTGEYLTNTPDCASMMDNSLVTYYEGSSPWATCCSLSSPYY